MVGFGDGQALLISLCLQRKHSISDIIRSCSNLHSIFCFYLLQLKQKLEEDVGAGKLTPQQRDQRIAQQVEADRKAYVAMENKLIAEEEELISGIQEQCDRDKLSAMREAHEALLMEVCWQHVPQLSFFYC